jgi:hypothetical protein
MLSTRHCCFFFCSLIVGCFETFGISAVLFSWEGFLFVSLTASGCVLSLSFHHFLKDRSQFETSSLILFLQAAIYSMIAVARLWLSLRLCSAFSPRYVFHVSSYLVLFFQCWNVLFQNFLVFGFDSIPAYSDAQYVPSFRRWQFEMKLSPFWLAGWPSFFMALG